MSILLFLVFGILVGLLARAIMPGRQSMGLVMTAVVGIVGSFVGGFLGNFLSGGPLLSLHPSGFIGSVVGSVVLLAVMGMAGRGRSMA